VKPIIKTLDALAKTAVFKRAKDRSELSGNITETLDPCHLYSKGSSPFVRWDLDNIWVLTREEHSHFHGQGHHAIKFFVIGRIGTKRFDELTRRAKGSQKHNSTDLEAIKIKLEEMLA
jgi:hypothetical protein